MQDRIKSLVATSLAHFVNDGNVYVFITLYPILFPLPYYSLGSTKLSALFLIGILTALQNIFSVAASPLIGRIADRTRRYRGLLSLGLFLMGIGIAGYALSIRFAQGFYLFLLLVPFSIIAGIGGAFYHPLGGSVLSETWPFRTLGRAMGMNGAFGSIGRAIYPLFVVALVAFFTVPAVLALAVLGFIIGFFIIAIMKQMNFTQSRQLGNDDTKGLEEGNNVRKNAIPFSVIFRRIFALTIVSFMRGVFAFGIVTFVLEYLERVGHLSYGLELGLAFTLILALPIAGQPFFGMFADRFGRRLALGISTLGSGVAILFLLDTSYLYLEIVLLALFGFFVFTQFPLVIPLATSAVPREASTLSNSIVWGIGNGGGNALGPFLVGLLAAPALLGSLNGAFLLVTIISLGSIPLLLLVPKPQSN
jgi:FSR family fosmidomycin resistance protein-like MFS transporter